MFTAGALEQGRNGWTHQRPEVEAYFAALMRNGNVFPLFPVDANMIQASYDWALKQSNKGIVITASKSPLPIHATHGAELPGDRRRRDAAAGDPRLAQPWCSR